MLVQKDDFDNDKTTVSVIPADVPFFIVGKFTSTCWHVYHADISITF